MDRCKGASVYAWRGIHIDWISYGLTVGESGGGKQNQMPLWPWWRMAGTPGGQAF